MDAIDTIKILGSLLGSGSLSKGSGGNVLGNILGSALGGSSSQQTQGGGALGDLLGSLLGNSNAKTTSGGGLGDLLGGLMKAGGSSQTQSGGGLGDLLGSLLGGSQQSQQQQHQQQSQGGGMGDLLGSLLGGGANSSQAGGLGGLLTGALTKYIQTQHADHPTPSYNDTSHLPQGLDEREATNQATLIIRAMINAAKSDGSFDEKEQEKILSRLGDLSPAEVAFIKREFNAPLDVEKFVREVPKGMEQQIYAISLTAIDLDNNREARYLAQLAQGLGISPQMANAIHEHLGAPKIFA